jgi:hypothetical protein
VHQLNAAKAHCVHLVNRSTTISFNASSVSLVGFTDPDAVHVTDFLFA